MPLEGRLEVIECAECTAENGGSWELQVAPLSGRDRPPNQVIWLRSPGHLLRDPWHRVGYKSSSGSVSPRVVRVVATHGIIRKSPALSMIQSHSGPVANRATALETLEAFAQLFVCLFTLEFLAYDLFLLPWWWWWWWVASSAALIRIFGGWLTAAAVSNTVFCLYAALKYTIWSNAACSWTG